MFHVKHYENIINEEWLHMSRFTMKTERGTFYDVREMTKDSAKKRDTHMRSVASTAMFTSSIAMTLCIMTPSRLCVDDLI